MAFRDYNNWQAFDRKPVSICMFEDNYIQQPKFSYWKNHIKYSYLNLFYFLKICQEIQRQILINIRHGNSIHYGRTWVLKQSPAMCI